MAFDAPWSCFLMPTKALKNLVLKYVRTFCASSNEWNGPIYMKVSVHNSPGEAI